MFQCSLQEGPEGSEQKRKEKEKKTDAEDNDKSREEEQEHCSYILLEIRILFLFGISTGPTQEEPLHSPERLMYCYMVV